MEAVFSEALHGDTERVRDRAVHIRLSRPSEPLLVHTGKLVSTCEVLSSHDDLQSVSCRKKRHLIYHLALFFGCTSSAGDDLDATCLGLPDGNCFVVHTRQGSKRVQLRLCKPAFAQILVKEVGANEVAA